jgi:hypothetical protein
MVRLVGDFPNTRYLLAFDRHRVEECFGENDIERGRACPEKIVQVTHDVPAARQPDVTAIFLAGLARILDDLPAGPSDVGDWQNILVLAVRPLLVTPRGWLGRRCQLRTRPHWGRAPVTSVVPNALMPAASSAPAAMSRRSQPPPTSSRHGPGNSRPASECD